LTELIAGPSRAEAAAGMTSAVPSDTAVTIAGISGGVATVCFPPAFSAGGRTAVRLRQAQVVYTLTEFPTVSRVALQSAGQPVAAPVRRSRHADLFAPIVVSDPVVGQRVSSPVTRPHRERVRGDGDPAAARRVGPGDRHPVHDRHLRQRLPGQPVAITPAVRARERTLDGVQIVERHDPQIGRDLDRQAGVLVVYGLLLTGIALTQGDPLTVRPGLGVPGIRGQAAAWMLGSSQVFCSVRVGHDGARNVGEPLVMATGVAADTREGLVDADAPGLGYRALGLFDHDPAVQRGLQLLGEDGAAADDPFLDQRDRRHVSQGLHDRDVGVLKLATLGRAEHVHGADDLLT
jgi:hypothetical protein